MLQGFFGRLRVATAAIAMVALSFGIAPAQSSGAALPVSGGAAARRGGPPEAPAAVTEHVIIVSIDGLRPDAIAEYGAETLQRLMREGAYSLEAETIYPSKTLPSHTSMLTGVPPSVHGVEWNSRQTDEHGIVGVPTVFEVAKAHGYHTAAFFSKAKFRHLLRPGSLDYWQAPASNLGHRMATWTVPAAIRYIEHERPNLIFVHIGEPDYAGHTIGWMSFVYGWAVRRADAAVEALVEAADDAYGRGKYTLLVTADHGGHGRDHGSRDPRDMTIPWILWGEGVRAGTRLPAGIHTMDTAATALRLLGIEPPAEWTGRAVAAALRPTLPVASRAAGF
ncbi:MAG TPA: ectonucleotide pyrophosphatase/phosphodiesterase [Longimicrobiales bacterium]